MTAVINAEIQGSDEDLNGNENDVMSLNGIEVILSQPPLVQDVQDNQEAEQDANSKASWDVIDRLLNDDSIDPHFNWLQEILATSSQTVLDSTIKEYQW